MKMTNIITILGATACGKTTLAVALANAVGGEIISADSRQVYRGMDIGTGKDLDEYTIEGHTIPYHLIDIVNAGYKYNLFEYQRDFLNAFNDITERKAMPILCGGTGLYIEAALKGYRLIEVAPNESLRKSLANKSLKELTNILSTYKTLHNTTDVDTPKRAIRAIEIADYYEKHPQQENDYPYLCPLIVGIDIDRELRRTKITQRLKKRLNEGLIEEVENLLKKDITPEDLIYYGLEYKFVTQHIIGKLTREQLFTQLETAIHQFAKRQMTWFRGMERRGFTIHWIDAELPTSEKIKRILSLL
ncbi:MAG TPA: tRNA (adenosine(37)-N6)-dimethylallyltransferase MiaA [Paludibacteraceae bacterium]|nr:tRNA (adenosine(37)-N6)-dimethylallyltransferase MiaA [Paludibacteraceae bacterium]HOS37502.1 tRNA (adenosine(37)-N6)-dimethylallyltransferase MiaA [Paludibacteraceae bacterium]HPK20199.1 tRNA (adenosine(37)-N6)-dimethylallyltransferase MiaA [Paludibacteraceae bacterium]HPO48051.1 tRNA (adenosine(37)-N6)-dimethylallyltransferase MiaA [Paludibacteraceae bacterium]